MAREFLTVAETEILKRKGIFKPSSSWGKYSSDVNSVSGYKHPYFQTTKNVYGSLKGTGVDIGTGVAFGKTMIYPGSFTQKEWIKYDKEVLGGLDWPITPKKPPAERITMSMAEFTPSYWRKKDSAAARKISQFLPTVNPFDISGPTSTRSVTRMQDMMESRKVLELEKEASRLRHGKPLVDYWSTPAKEPKVLIDHWADRGASDVTEKSTGLLSRLKGMMPGGGSAGALGKTYGDYYKDIPGGTVSKSFLKSNYAKAIGVALGAMALFTSPKGREAVEDLTGVQGTEALSPFRRVAAQAMWGRVEEAPQTVGIQAYAAMSKGYSDIAADAFKYMRVQLGENIAFMKEYGQENEIMTNAMNHFNEATGVSIDLGEATNNRDLERKRIIEITKPAQDNLNKSLEIQTLEMEANRRELKYKQEDLTEVNTTIGRLTGARFRTGATIGGTQVSSQLGGMEHMWGLQKSMLEAKRAALVAPDPFAQYNQMAGAERMAGGAGRVGVAQANLSYVTAATGTSAKDRAMVAVQQLRAEEGLRSAQAGLDIETERQRAEAADMTGKAYDESAKKFQLAQLDMQLTYGNMEKELEFFVAAHQDAANAEDGIPGSLDAIQTKLKTTWKSQATLNDSIDGLKTSISGNEESIAAFKENLRRLKEDGVDYLNESLREHIRLRGERDGYSPLTGSAPDLVDAPSFENEEIKTSGYIV